MSHAHAFDDRERGTSLVELMIALVILSVGLLAVAQLFPAGSRGQLQDRMLTTANYHAQEKIELLVTRPWNHQDLTPGRHPPGAAVEDLGRFKRFYEVELLTAPLDNLKRVTVTINWTYQGARSVTATTYLRR